MNDESNSYKRIQTCGICEAIGHNRRKCIGGSQNAQHAVGGFGIPSSQQTYNAPKPTVEYNYHLVYNCLL